MPSIKIVHLSILTIMLFSVWAAFALLVVNPIFNADLPGYRIGRICTWEYIALAIAVLCSFVITKFWGFPEVVKIGGHNRLTMNTNYGYFFLCYFIAALAIAIWQFWIFSMNF